MMENTKTVFKYFTIPQYQQEEDFLSDMHEKGWRFTHAAFPGIYHFVECEPGKAAYRLDYNPEGSQNREEYLQMFSDCGWEYVCDFVGYSYFRKEGAVGAEREEIFCDDASRLDMMKRVFAGRFIPLICLFALVILPQLFLNTAGYGGSGRAQDILSFVFLGLAVLYLILFSITAVQFYKYEKQITGDSQEIRLKYVGAFAMITGILIGIGIFFWSSHDSDYDIKEKDTGYVVEAELLNTSVVTEHDLKKGDVVEFHITDMEKGSLHLSIAENGKEPVFFGDFHEAGDHTVEIHDDGHYQIEISGKRLSGDVEVVIID